MGTEGGMPLRNLADRKFDRVRDPNASAFHVRSILPIASKESDGAGDFPRQDAKLLVKFQRHLLSTRGTRVLEFLTEISDA